MKPRPPQTTWKLVRPGSQLGQGGPFADRLLSVVDAGLIATICAAPFIFGGRHDIGRLVFVLLVGVTAAAWFFRQSLLPQAAWTRTAAYGVLLSAIALVALQLMPMPAEWLARLSPRTMELLPLWTSSGSDVRLGTWKTLSFTPHETLLALAMLVSYGLLFSVLTQRLQTTADVEKLLNTVAVAAVLMAGFGLLQFFTSNGQFFWCYVHPYRTTDQIAMGSFMNRNHFASFLVLGVGPLVRWLVTNLRTQWAGSGRRRSPYGPAAFVVPGLLLAAISIVLLGVALTLSKGGTMALVSAMMVISAIYWRWQLVDSKYFYGLAGIGLVMLGLLSIYGYEELTGRLDAFTAGSIEALDRAEGRRKVWAANVEAFQQGWLTGAGAGSHREICPVYLAEPTPGEYTHAENGYLQIATENGIVGVVLLAAGIGLCGIWTVVCLGRLQDREQQLCFGAAAAGIAASLVHSLVDFVWYIPACMSLTLVLAVCTLRLAQLSLPNEKRSTTASHFARPRWLECAAVATMLAGWTTYVFFGPAVAAVHWDRYLRDAVAAAGLFDRQLSPLAGKLDQSDKAMREPLSDSMQHHLEETVRWDPSFARAHSRLAERYIQRFELAQQNVDNAMTLQSIRDAVQASAFASPEELRAWLQRAFGANMELLYRARAHAQLAVASNPLQGEAYIYLANLDFIAGEKPRIAKACIDQAQRVRPYDGNVMYEVGKQLYLQGEYDAAMNHWAKCFANSGKHQLRIVNLLAGRLPASVLLEALKPDWRTLREIWACYPQAGQRQEREALIAYAAKVTQRDIHDKNGIPPVYIWLWQSSMYADLDQHDQALACLEHAYQCDQHVYDVRYELAYALKDAGRLAEAEPHLRWCSARRPEDKGLSAAILEITKLRLAQSDRTSIPVDTGAGNWRR